MAETDFMKGDPDQIILHPVLKFRVKIVIMKFGRHFPSLLYLYTRWALCL